MPKIKIASFNVNSVKARLPNVLDWAKRSNPDVILLQELKCVAEDFPKTAFFDAGYNAAVLGQKTYNGVAILSKFKIEDVVKSLPNFGEEKDEQARYVEAVISAHGQAIRLASIYVPNGGGEILPGQNLIDTAKFRYKMDFFDRLNSHIEKLLTYDEMQIFGGDYNVAVEDIDVFDPKSLRSTVCFHEDEQKKFRRLLNLGLVDCYRALHPKKQDFSWWDYRSGAWQHNKGLRIDYLLASPLAADKVIEASLEDKGVRDQEKASDHCPVTAVFEI